MNMAKRKYSKMTKIQPAVQKMFFAIPNWDGVSSDDTHHYIDLSQCASLANRRFYRQGINWAVADMTLHVKNQFGQEYVKPGQNFTVNKLPNTWVMSNAWEKGFRAWQRMNNEALAETESIKPKFLDFKIYADARHHQNGFERNLLPAGLAAGEWESSKYSIPASTGSTVPVAYDREVIAVGPSYPGGGASGLNAVSLIEGYATSRALPDIRDPNVPSDALDADGNDPQNWLVAITNEGTEQDADILETMITENNVAPYPFEGGPIVGGGIYTDTMYPGGGNNSPNLEPFSLWATPLTSVNTRFSMGGSNFPCGLIHIQNNITIYGNADFSGNPEAGTYSFLEITLVPGNHRGYLCEPMTDM